MRAIQVETAVVEEKGFENDRRYMVVAPLPLPTLYGEFLPHQPTHRFVTQRQFPTLATVDVRLSSLRSDGGGGEIELTSAKLPRGKKSRVAVTFPTSPAENAPRYVSTLWDDRVVVQDMGVAAAQFVKDLARRDPEVVDELKTADLRIVTQSEEDARQVPDDFTPASTRRFGGFGGLFGGKRRRQQAKKIMNNPSVSLADGFPLLLGSKASLEELNRRLVSKNKEPLPMSRFRPNIVIAPIVSDEQDDDDDNGLQPFEEDHWKVVRIGECVFHVVKPCPRCKQSCTDQLTGEVTDEPLTTLREFRAMDPSNKDNLYFAQNAIPDPGTVGRSVKVGDEVEVLQWGEPIYTG